ncbi:uncharacterized protein STEHIDRAFT_163677 [Stereum hirsutum FP-91666 SS1]|uniref:Uncharacterized protein n=1 Tax=Stereum hirsutum (strain FP-91666) TaxID=721885 RepID=R7RX99_STEHR|nr:uncharacterized protein STEHIDRAFT_163677 [Stereum hirsutum FP-91666 SS1]EIM79490.1 hypothetical protein STEHIDRAFT_163677 [Stereum hirsutum FP-91666 SS1]
MYDGAEYEDTYGMGRMDWTLDKSLEHDPFDQWDANPRSRPPDALECGICSNFTCCGLTIPDMHDLLAHFEDSHVLVLKTSLRNRCLSVLRPASQTSPSPYSYQNDEYDPEPFVLSYPQPPFLPSPSPTPSFSSATQTFSSPGVCIPSGSRASTPELSAAGSDFDPVSSSPSSAFSPLSPFIPYPSAFSAAMSDDPAYSLLHATSLSRRGDCLAIDMETEGTTSIYAHPGEVGAQAQTQTERTTLESNINLPTSHPILSLPPASFSLPASTSATRLTPAAKAKKTKTSSHARDRGFGRRECAEGESKNGRRELGGAGAGGSGGLGLGLGTETQRGPRGKFVSDTMNTMDKLGAGSSSDSGSGSGGAVGDEIGRGSDERTIHPTTSS